MVSNDIVATGYLVVKGARSHYGPSDPETGLKSIDSAKITMARQGRSPRLGADEILIKVAIQLPKSVFDPITPSALIVVPEELILDRHTIEVEATEEAEG
jgi:hypothetical protein